MKPVTLEGFSREGTVRCYIFTTIEYKTFFLVQIIIIMLLKSDSLVKELRSVWESQVQDNIMTFVIHLLPEYIMSNVHTISSILSCINFNLLYPAILYDGVANKNTHTHTHIDLLHHCISKNGMGPWH